MKCIAISDASQLNRLRISIRKLTLPVNYYFLVVDK